MAAPLVNNSGTCTLCEKESLNETDVISCYECQKYFHGDCGQATHKYCCKSFLTSFQKQTVKTGNFVFVCDMCLTRKENNLASSINEQISSLTEVVNNSFNDKISILTNTVNSLVSEVNALKEQNACKANDEDEVNVSQPWSNVQRVAKMKASLCIKSNGAPVDLMKVQEIATTHSIQVFKTVVKENGDVFLNLPSRENRDKLSPLLQNETFERNEVVSVKSKLPTISILNVKDYTNKEEFVNKIKQQNPTKKGLMDNGSELSIVFCKEPKVNDNNGRTQYYQVVARVGEDIRRAIKNSDDKIYMDLVALQVVDRFFVKRCNCCQKFGHYQKDCTEESASCGYCKGNHLSKDCNDVQEGHFKHYECVNCERGNKNANGHSAHWHKCPTYLDLQKKVKKLYTLL